MAAFLELTELVQFSLIERNVENLETAPRQCLNCNAAIAHGQNYCPVCGQKAHTPRLTLHEIGEELFHAVAHVDRSALSLVWLLMVRPGVVARQYVSGKRKRYYGPFAFLVVTVAFTAAAIAISGFEAVSANNPNWVADFLQHHVNLMFFAQVPLLAAFSRLSGFREPYNYAEYLVVSSYTSAMHILYYGVIIVPIWYFLHSDTALMIRLYYVNLFVGPLYFAFATYQFLPGSRLASAVKGLLASVLTLATTWGVVQVLANL